jgi:hypothetical protein
VQVITSYKLRPEEVRPTLGRLQAVYDELAAREPSGLRWASFQLSDGVSFLSFVEFEGTPGEAPHHRLEAFREYRSKLDASCEEPPHVEVLREIGSFGVRGIRRPQ